MMKKLMMMSVTLLGSLMNATMNATLLNTTLLHESKVQAQYTEVPGSDMDGYGCVGSAGYTWCESINTCIREWETPCPLTNDNSVTNDNSATTIPVDCVSWYDGCNTCSVANGAIELCTMMYCYSPLAPACLAYSQGH